MAVQWGDVPTWLGAVGTIAAASVAVFLAHREAERAVVAEHLAAMAAPGRAAR